jgi:6-phosphogluconate dehydrogenase
MDLPDIAEVWRRGGGMSSWPCDRTAATLTADLTLASWQGTMADCARGRWTTQISVDKAVAARVLGAALYARSSSRSDADFAMRVLAAMREEFEVHKEKPAAQLTAKDGR